MAERPLCVGGVNFNFSSFSEEGPTALGRNRVVCEIRNVLTAVDPTVASTNTLRLFVTKVPIKR
jgi:hypothetical protein